MVCDDLDCLPALPDDEDLVPSRIVKKENGGISDMTLWRWTRDPRIQFPQPDVVINGRKYWTRRTLRRHRRRLEAQQQALSKSRTPQGDPALFVSRTNTALPRADRNGNGS
ncbi:MAG: hypothetical protein WCD69_15990 [Xanthobacteraceae bacterium]